MRSDMCKVIVERPRVLGWKHKRGKDDQRARQDPEEAPLQESSARGRKRNHKYLNENLAPLRRFVLGQVGRRWDSVHAEICEHLRLTSAVQQHVLQHLDDFVVKDVEMVDGKPVHRADHRPVVGSRWRALAWVCPRTGILRASISMQMPAASSGRPSELRRVIRPRCMIHSQRESSVRMRYSSSNSALAAGADSRSALLRRNLPASSGWMRRAQRSKWSSPWQGSRPRDWHQAGSTFPAPVPRLRLQAPICAAASVLRRCESAVGSVGSGRRATSMVGAVCLKWGLAYVSPETKQVEDF